MVRYMQALNIKNSQKLNILIADDHLINQLFIQAILNGSGHSCFVAHNGVEVLKLMEDQAYDLVLMDGNMPIMDGYQATAEIRRLEKISGNHKHIIAVTAATTDDDKALCIAAGMDDHISKPIDPKVLLQKIEELSRTKANEQYNVVEEIIKADQLMLNNHALSSIKPIDLKKIIDMMLNFLPLALEQLEIAYSEDDPMKIAQIAHNIAGTTSMVDATTLFNTASQLEQTARDGELENIEQLIQDLKPLIKSYMNDLSKLTLDL